MKTSPHLFLRIFENYNTSWFMLLYRFYPIVYHIDLKRNFTSHTQKVKKIAQNIKKERKSYFQTYKQFKYNN